MLKVGPKGYDHGWVFVGIPGAGGAVVHPELGPGKVVGAGTGDVTVRFTRRDPASPYLDGDPVSADHTFERRTPPGRHSAAGHFEKREPEASGGTTASYRGMPHPTPESMAVARAMVQDKWVRLTPEEHEIVATELAGQIDKVPDMRNTLASHGWTVSFGGLGTKEGVLGVTGNFENAEEVLRRLGDRTTLMPSGGRFEMRLNPVLIRDAKNANLNMLLSQDQGRFIRPGPTMAEDLDDDNDDYLALHYTIAHEFGHVLARESRESPASGGNGALISAAYSAALGHKVDTSSGELTLSPGDAIMLEDSVSDYGATRWPEMLAEMYAAWSLNGRGKNQSRIAAEAGQALVREVERQHAESSASYRDRLAAAPLTPASKSESVDEDEGCSGLPASVEDFKRLYPDKIVKGAQSGAVATQLSADYPPDSLGWVRKLNWKGPEEIPLNTVDMTRKKTWAAWHEQGRVDKMAAKIVKRRKQGRKIKPVVLVDTPDTDPGTNLKVIDGHHRTLAYAKLKLPVWGYVAKVPDVKGPWDTFHNQQEPEDERSTTDDYAAKVGPKGYEHGWIYVGPEGGQKPHGIPVPPELPDRASPYLTGFAKLMARKPDLKRLGQCYKLAAEYLVGHPGADRLVHGSIQGMGAPRIGHAWVTLGNGDVWEPASDLEYTAAEFAAVYHPKVSVSYSRQEALEHMLRYEHYGPWDDDDSGKKDKAEWSGWQHDRQQASDLADSLTGQLASAIDTRAIAEQWAQIVATQALTPGSPESFLMSQVQPVRSALESAIGPAWQAAWRLGADSAQEQVAKMSVPQTVKVGPKGYIHGWVYVGPTPDSNAEEVINRNEAGKEVDHPVLGHGKVTQVTISDDEQGTPYQAHVRFDSGEEHAFDYKDGDDDSDPVVAYGEPGLRHRADPPELSPHTPTVLMGLFGLHSGDFSSSALGVIADYVSPEGGELINGILRGDLHGRIAGQNQMDRALREIGTMDKLLSRYKTRKPYVAYRGISVTPALEEQIKPGKTYTDNGYISTSSSPEWAQRFADLRTNGSFASSSGGEMPEVTAMHGKPAVMRVHVPPGTHMLPGEPDIGEWILPRGTSFRVNEVNPGMVDVTVVPHEAS